jgi:hypothetical protein
MNIPEYIARILKLLRSPGIDSKKSIPPAFQNRLPRQTALDPIGSGSTTLGQYINHKMQYFSRGDVGEGMVYLMKAAKTAQSTSLVPCLAASASRSRSRRSLRVRYVFELKGLSHEIDFDNIDKI